MLSEFLKLSKEFYRLASTKDLSGEFDWLKNKLELEKSWNAVRDDATARIFFQELKSKPGDHKDKIRAVKLLYEIKKALSTWREKAIEVLNFEHELIFYPSRGNVGNHFFKTIYEAILEFKNLISKFGGSKSFSDAHLQKMFRAIQIFSKLVESSEKNEQFPLQWYAELIYFPLDALYQKLKNKIESKLETTQEYINSAVEILESAALNIVTWLVPENSPDSEAAEKKAKMIDVLRDSLHDIDDLELAKKTILQKFSRILKVKKDQITRLGIWSEFEFGLQHHYNDRYYQEKENYQLMLKELATKKISKTMVEKFSTVVRIP